MILLSVNWTAVSAVATSISAIIALIVVWVNIKTIKETNEMHHMSNVPWFYIIATTRFGKLGDILVEIKNDANFVVSVDSITLAVVGTYKSLLLDFEYIIGPNSEKLGGTVQTTIPLDNSFLNKECHLIIRYKNQYSKTMKSISPTFDIFSEDDTNGYMSIERQGKPDIKYRPFRNEII